MVFLGRQSSLAGLADAARDAGEWDAAVTLYGSVLASDVRNAPLWVQYGHALKESGELKNPTKLARAETAYRRALIYAPRVADTHLQLGHVLKLQGRADEAKAAYLRALALDPALATAREELRRGRTDEAIAAYVRALALDTSLATLRDGLRELGWDEGDSAALHRALISLDGITAPRRRRPSLIEQADAARDAALWALAAQRYRAVLKRDPDNAAIWVQYGHAVKEAGNLKDPVRLAKAEAAYRRSLALAPEVADTHLQLGRVLKLEGKPQEAESAYIRSMALSSTKIDALRELESLGWSKSMLRELLTITADDGVSGDVEAVNYLEAGDRTDIVEVHRGVAGRAFIDRLRATPSALASEESAAAPEGEVFISFDSPELVDGAVALPTQCSLWINGWAMARAGVAALDVFINGARLGPAIRGLARSDVAAKFPNWPDAARSGFTMLIPGQRLPKGRHDVEIVLKDAAGRTQICEIAVNVENDRSDPLSLRRKIAQSEIDLDHRILGKSGWHPAFALLMLIGMEDSEIAQARATLTSLSRQAYRDWRVLVVRWRGRETEAWRERLMDGSETLGTVLAGPDDDRASPAAMRGKLLAGFEDIAGRVEILKMGDDRALAELAGNGPALLGLIAAGDELSADALLTLAVTSALDREADFLYSDEWRISPASGEAEPFLKPQWSPDLLLSTNYIGRLWCAAPRLLAQTGVTLADLVRFGEYDLVLRLTEAAAQISHAPELLCRRGPQRLDGTVAEREALERAMARRGIAGAVLEGCVPGTYRLKRTLIKPGLVSIIICTCAARGLIKKCLETLRALTAYRPFEIIIVENIPPAEAHWQEWLQANADHLVTPNEPFNWSRFNNLGAAAASGEYLLFLNDDIEIIEPDWLDALIEHGQRPEVGAVGARLLYPWRTVQHAGMFLTNELGIAHHFFHNIGEFDPGYFGLAQTQRNVIAVTGACLLTRGEIFKKLGGFNEAHGVINNDLDYCLKTWQAGLMNIFTPYANLIHHEGATRSNKLLNYDTHAFNQQWRAIFDDGDPYYHRHLSMESDHSVPEAEPLRLICAGRPLLRREEVLNILVVKLDHIGDCITAFAAIRRLKERFPEASLRVLAATWTKAIWSLADGIDEIIEFDFFHSRSDQGLREVTETELQSLRQRLAPYRFDLAIDMRRHLETRRVLQYTTARYLAGFDQQGCFPWLDIALEFEGDSVWKRKHHHESDGLIALVDVISAQCEPDRGFAPPERPPGPLPLPEATRLRLFRRRIVCVHIAAGTRLRQWPPGHFAELIDLLVEREDVTIALIGSGDDQETASGVLKHVRNCQAVVNLLGRIGLADLPNLMRRCALFVGNNSGPQHLAALLGVPTIGIHSAVVDAHEWGPVGPYAIALQRDMLCGPCYLPSPELCPRELACLTGLGPGEVYRACRKLLALDFGDRPLSQPSYDASAAGTFPQEGQSSRPLHRASSPCPPGDDRRAPWSAFTIVSRNYISYAATLMQSLAAHRPEIARYIFLADEPYDFSDLELPAALVCCKELGIPEFPEMAFRYSIMELNTAVKPSCIQWLFRQSQHDRVIYLDPDILVLRPLSEVIDLIDGGAPLVLTPHITEPLQDGYLPDDMHVMKSGVYNLGFAAFARCVATEALVDWWAARLTQHAFVDIPNHLFTDQRWMDLAPGFVADTAILRHPGYNAAYWNLAHRPITRDPEGGWRAAGEPLHFFHFSGINPLKPNGFSKHQNRFSLDTVGGLRPLVETYVNRLLANGYLRYFQAPYAYGAFADGRPIHPRMRACFRRLEEGGVALAGLWQAGGSGIFDQAEDSLRKPGLPDVTRIMYQLWLERDDLRREFNLDHAAGRCAFHTWYAAWGPLEAEIDAASLGAAAALINARVPS